MHLKGPTKSRPEPSEAVRTPSGCRPEPSGRRLDQSRVESVQDQHETCDTVLRFAICSRISFCITWSYIIVLIFHVRLVHDKTKVGEHVICVRFIPHQQLTVTGVAVAAMIKDWTRATPCQRTASPASKPVKAIFSEGFTEI